VLVIKRKDGERVYIGDDIVITVTRGSAGWLRLGIEAPPNVHIAREELLSPEERARIEERARATGEGKQ